MLACVLLLMRYGEHSGLEQTQNEEQEMEYVRDQTLSG